MPQTSPPDPNTSLWAWLAHDLRFYREKHGLSQASLGSIIGRTHSSLSNCEAARRRINEDEAKILDRLWDTGGHFRRLLLFARLSHDPDWFREHVEYEAKAEVIKIFETMFVPGLLQTPEYAKATLVAGAHVDPESGAAARMARQAILDQRRPPTLWVILDMAVLCRPVGGVETMRGQLAHLLQMMQRPDVGVRVVPWSAGEYIGQDGAFKLLAAETSDVAYAEAPTGGRLVMEPREVRGFGLRYDRIGAKALPDDLSRGLITEAMEALR